jgi:hypothetical protein
MLNTTSSDRGGDMADQYVMNDLRAESEQIDRMVADLDEQEWRLPTPATWWTVADQIAHLAFIFT